MSKESLSTLIPIVLVVAFAGIAVLIGWLASKAAERRRAQLAEFAARHGFVFDPNAGNDLNAMGCAFPFGNTSGGYAGRRLLEMFEGFSPFGEGHSKRIDEVILGQKGDRCYYFFHYQYTTGSGKDQTTWNYGIAAVRLPLAFPPLDIRPEVIFDRIGGLLGIKDIQFEMEEFNKAYFVRCENQKFAFDVVHPQAIEYLLRIERRSWQFGGPLVVVRQTGRYDAHELDRVLADMDGFLDLIPAYVREDIGFNARWQTPLD